MNPSRETLHLFDLMFKFILKEASHPALVQFINGLFDKHYPQDSPVTFAPTETVTHNAEHLETLRSDMLLTVANDAYLIEAQISDDENIALRVFQYALAYAHTTKVIEAERITLTMPEARVIYWETSRKTPDTVTVRIIFPDKTEHCYEIPTLKLLEQSVETMERRHLVLLAPFYLLKYRNAVRKGRLSAEERRALAGELKELVGALEGMVDRAREAGIISGDDTAALFEHLVQMYTELYRSYPEFKEAAMHLEERVKTQWQHYLHQGMQQGVRQGVHQGKVEERNRLISLLEQGYTLNQIKSLLAQESGQEPSGEAVKT
jgi:hypothetical protein